ncbi:MAG: thiamine biosynthesis lipoprotein [Halioglobus sp.]|jgi:thiamine biosynthesis lipoprotein
MDVASNRQSHLRRWLFYWLVVCVACLSACAEQLDSISLSGATMGTTWHLSFLGDPADIDNIQQGIERQLQRVNESMSTYQGDSEISRFNASPTHEAFSLSSDFITVLDAALTIGLASHGAYDVTVGPVVNLWGFGSELGANQVPDKTELQRLVDHIGQDKLQLDRATASLLKTDQLALDFSSIAKGYAVDLIADWLFAQGISNFLVEVGGEVRVAGENARGTLWRIAVERPDAMMGAVAAALTLTDNGIATSGDYRNYFERDGKRYSHTIDPRTGFPVAHDLVSVTVVHPQAMMADGWATALMVLGAQEGMKVALAQNLAVYFIRRTEDNYKASYSPLFADYLESPQEH